MERSRKMSKIFLEPLKKSHIEGIIRIESLCFSVPWSKEAFLQELNNEIAYYLVAIDHGQVLGYGGMWIILDEAHITNVAVTPMRQREGIAKDIVEGLIKRADEFNVLAMTLEVRMSNQTAIDLYKKFHFEEAGIRKGYYENNNENALIMWRKRGELR